MTIIIENVKEEFLPALRGLTKTMKAKMKTRKEKEYYTLRDCPAIKKIDRLMEENPEIAEQARIELEREMREYASQSTK